MLQPVVLPAALQLDGSTVAGSRFCQMRDVIRFGEAGPTAFSDLPEADRQRLGTLRPDVMGLTLDRPLIMGILNVTPDSFSDGGLLGTVAGAVARAVEMAKDVAILDIGGESTRPGAAEVTIAEEIDRTAPVIRAIRNAGIATPISIDTRKAAVAQAALAAGADMVNDVTALRFDPDMAGVVADAGCPVCLMHSKGRPETMQNDPRYGDVVGEVWTHLADRIAMAEMAGISRANIIADPGIGFGKTMDHNLALLQNISVFHDLGVAVLLGASRKTFIGKLSGVDAAADRVAGSLSVALHGASQAIQLLRVHDTSQTRQALDLWAAQNGR